jgi:LysR family transcriptional regulator, transcriptional activator of nhaA
VNATLNLVQPVQLMCREGTWHELLRALESRQLDAVLSDSPVMPSLNLRAYNHHLGGCDVLWMAAPQLDFGNPLRSFFAAGRSTSGSMSVACGR